MTRIERVFNQVAQDRGKRSEARVAIALGILIENKEINSFESSPDLDRRGIDFLVVCGSKRYKISVKSSQRGGERELEEHPNRARR